MTTAIAAIVWPFSVSAQETPQKFVRPPRFMPPVHAQPLRDPGQSWPSPQPLRNVLQVSAVQEFDLPLAQAGYSQTQQHVPADQWQSRQAPASNRNAWQELAAPDSSLPEFDLSDVPPQAPSTQDNESGWNNSNEKSVLVRSPEQSRSTPDKGNELRQIQVEPRRLSSGHSTPANFRNPPAAFSQESDGTNPNVARGRKSCEVFRSELLNAPITDIVLDTSPLRPTHDTNQRDLTRTWTDCNGNTLGIGTLTGLERSYIVIANESGTDQRITTSQLSDGDLAIVTSYWALPNECSLGCYPFEGRCWVPNTMLWNASALCHKPLYFENVQLERYGHTHGPIMQPIRSTAHFFISLISLPYQTGIHPSTECVYALGYYRPGDCAPWLMDPIPLSLNGAVRQAGFVAGAAAILP